MYEAMACLLSFVLFLQLHKCQDHNVTTIILLEQDIRPGYNASKKALRGRKGDFMNLINLLEGKKIRSCRDKDTNKLWLSAVDVCAAIRGVDYQTARNYWKWFKTKLAAGLDNITVSRRIKMAAADGKLRQTDVVGVDEVVLMINACPSKAVEVFRQWLKNLAAMKEDIVEVITDTVAKVKHKTGDTLYIITREIMYNSKKIMPVNPVFGGTGLPVLPCQKILPHPRLSLT